jgi:hypothetical protein
MGWSSSSPSASAATSAGYRPYEDDSRGTIARGATITAVLATAGIALGASPSRLAGVALIGIVLLGPVHAWTELGRLRKGLEAARSGPLPLLAAAREDAVRPKGWSLSTVGWTILAVLLAAAFVAYFVFSFDDAVRILLGGMAGLVAGEVIVLGWLRRRRARDGMQIYVRVVEGDEETADPPRLHLVPRGS